LVSAQQEGRTTQAADEHALILRASGVTSLGVGRCSQWLGSMHFRGGKADVSGRVSPHHCPLPESPTLDGPDPIESIEAVVMQGSLRWSLRGDRLMLTKDLVGVLIFSRGPSNPPSSSS
jgi:hypothetical protein